MLTGQGKLREDIQSKEHAVKNFFLLIAHQRGHIYLLLAKMSVYCYCCKWAFGLQYGVFVEQQMMWRTKIKQLQDTP